MDELRIEGCENPSRSKSKKACSFSIERILKRDEVETEETDLVKCSSVPCCHSPHIPCNEESCKTVSSKSSSPCRPHPSLSAFSVCRHPVCPIPTNPIIHTDPYYEIFAPRAFSRYSSFTSSVPRIHDVGYLRGNHPFEYNRGLLRYFHDTEMTSSIGLQNKQPVIIDERNDAKRKGGQVRFSHVQSVELERIFSLQKYISPQERKQLSRFLQLSERQVKTWFQNRRAKWRRIKMEAEMRRRMSHEKGSRQRFRSSEELPRESQSRNSFDEDFERNS